MSDQAEAGREALLQILQRMEMVAETNVAVANRLAAQQSDLVQGQESLAAAYNQAAAQARMTNTILLKLCEKLDQASRSSNVLADSLDGVPVMEARARHGGRSLASQALQGILGGVVGSVAPPFRPPPPPYMRPPQRRTY